MILTIIAVIIALLLWWANFYTTFKTNDFMHAGAEALLCIAIITFFHAFLLFILIRTTKLSLGYTTLVWGFLIILYLLPFAKMKHENLKREKKLSIEYDLRQHIYKGTATMSDFCRLYENNKEEIIVEALKNGYSEIAKEVLAAVCGPSYDRIIHNRYSYLAPENDVELYGEEVARQKYLRALYFMLEDKELTEGIEYLRAAVPDIINIDRYDFASMLYDLQKNGSQENQ